MRDIFTEESLKSGETYKIHVQGKKLLGKIKNY